MRSLKPKKPVKRGVPQQGMSRYGFIVNYNKGRAWNPNRPHKGEKK